MFRSHKSLIFHRKLAQVFNNVVVFLSFVKISRCIPCFREEDCGNGKRGNPETGVGKILPDPTKNWCISAVHDYCVEEKLDEQHAARGTFSRQN